MDADLAVLKQRADHADQRMERMEQKLDRIVDKLDGLATKTTVWSALGTGAALSFAIVAIFVGVLTYLQDQRIALRPEPAAPTAAPPAVIIQLPPWPTAPAPPASTAPAN